MNCGRGYYQTQTNLRLSKCFNLGGRAHVEAIGEIFNLFNNINPSGFRARVIVPATGAPDPDLLQPDHLLRRLPSSRNSGSASSGFRFTVLSGAISRIGQDRQGSGWWGR